LQQIYSLLQQNSLARHCQKVKKFIQKRRNEDQTAQSERFLCIRLTSSMRRNFVTNIVIVSAARTAVGSFGGAFANTPADALGTSVLKAVVARAGIDPSEVSETILGQVLTAGQGQNPARQAHINAGLPIESAAWSINQVCPAHPTG
jgi:hypothetical protein